MKQWLGMPVVAALVLSACVTINVYFPAAEAREAAREFVEKVIDEADKVEIKDGGGGMAALQRRFEFDPEALFVVGLLHDVGTVVALGTLEYLLAQQEPPPPRDVSE